MVAAVALGLVALIGAAGCGGADRATSGGPQTQGPVEGADLSGGSGGGGGGGEADRGAAQEQPASVDQRKVVRAAELSIRVDDIPAAVREAAAAGPRFGGYVAEEDSDNSRATVHLKVDSAKLDEALTALGDLGEVVSRRQQATDVTDQAVDLQARIAAQRASVDRVRTLLANATTVGEIMDIESELTTRQAALDSLEQRLAALDGRTDLADVTVLITRSGSPIAKDDDTGFLAGLAAGWAAFLGATEVGLTVLGALLPFALALALPVAFVVWLVRRSKKPLVTRPEPSPSRPNAG